MSQVSAPIGTEEFSLLMQGFAPFPKKIALAVSGGPDSMALAFCIKRWSGAECVAFIVDHGLREESADEAAEVKKRLTHMGIQTEILRWTHGAISSRLHVIAREARYRLLTDACRTFGAGDLFMAHQAEDQAETILMRFAKGTGIDGLAGIPACGMREAVRLIRPFLSVSKKRLIETCTAASIKTVTDPSNEKVKYARGRLRKIMPLLAAEGFTVERLTTLGIRAQEAKEALDHMTYVFLEKAAQTEMGGSVRMDREALRGLPRALALRAFGACLRYVHEKVYSPEYNSLSATLDAFVRGGDAARTLYGCIISPSEKHITILREPTAANEALPISPGQAVLWDGRWVVTARAGTTKGTIRALGNPPHERLDVLAPGLRKQIPQGRIRAGLPAIWEDDSLCAIPSFGEGTDFQAVFYKQGIIQPWNSSSS